MINIISKPLEFEEELKRKIEFICDFCNTKPKIINGNIRNIEHTNLSYIEPHRVIIKGITFLVFNYSKILYINNLSNAIEIKDLENYIKKKINDKIILKTKNQLLNENQKLSKQNEDLKHENYQLKYKNKELEEQKNYLLYYIKKFLDKMPKVIKDIIDKVFDRNMSVDLYKSQYDPEMLEKQQKRIEANNRIFNLFNKREIEKATKHLNNEMDEAAEEFYKTKKDKEKDDGLSL